jgi:glycosyltransferase involved in cell wall biosynthesis
MNQDSGVPSEVRQASRRPRRRPRGNVSDGRVSVVVPARDEVLNLPLLFEKFAVEMNSGRLRGEVILVDDGSIDDTYQVAKAGAAQYPWLRVKRHAANQGLTAALKTGFDAARHDIMIFWPADLQYLPEDIPPMVARFQEGCDVVTGWKQGRYGVKRFVSVVYNWTSRLLFNVKVHDLNSVKGFRREVIEKIPWRKDWHRYMVVWAAEGGFTIGEVKVKLYPRHRGKTKFSVWRIPVGVLDLLAVKFRMSFLSKPLLFFGTGGMVLIVLGFVVGAVAIYLRFALSEGYRPLLYLVILCETVGVMLFAIGFLAEAIVDLGDRMQGQIDRLGRRSASGGHLRHSAGRPEKSGAKGQRPPTEESNAS